MYYKELLYAWRALLLYIAIVGALVLLSIAAQSMGHHVYIETPATGSLGRHQSVHTELAVLKIPISVFLVIASVAAAIFATFLGLTLSRENDGHLEMAWTLPMGRVPYALRMMGIDVAAILAAFAFAFVGSIAVIYTHGAGKNLYADPNLGLQAVRYIIYPMAWFGLVQGISASVRGRAGAYAGLAWPISMVLVAFYEAPFPAPLHNFFRAVNLVNPLMYASYASGPGASDAGILNLNLQIAIAALTLIAIAGITAALVQWRRLEA